MAASGLLLFGRWRGREGEPLNSLALIAALFIWLFVLLLWANFVNLGVFPLEIVVLSLLFNLLELPGAVIAGASVYREKPAT